MPELNFATLKDRLLDVDPDIRFMGLRDLINFLTTLWRQFDSSKAQLPVSSRHIMTFLDTFLCLLKDLNCDVQGQAIHVFATTTPFLASDDLLILIEKLYSTILAELNRSLATKGFTTSVPYMALKAVINLLIDLTSESLTSRALSIETRPTPINYTTAKSIVDAILPRLLSSPITIDSVELLLDIVLKLGYTLDQDEVLSLAKYLIRTVFTESGIVSKRAIVTFDSLCNLMTSRDYLNESLDLISKHHNRRGSRTFNTLQCLLFSIVFRNPVGIDSGLLRSLVDELIANLRMIPIDEVANMEHNVDFDFDVLVEENLLRENILGALCDLLLSQNNLEDYKVTIFEVIRYFLKFDPLLTDGDDSEMDFDSGEADIEFSDEENDNDTDENDGSWKLRAKASCMARIYFERWPTMQQTIYENLYPYLPVQDRNELVSHEALSTVAFMLESTTEYNELIFVHTKDLVLSTLLDRSDAQSLPQFFSIIASLSRFSDIDFIKGLFQKLAMKSHSTWSDIGILDLYSTLLENCADCICQFETEVIADAIIKALSDRSFPVVMRSLQLAGLFLESGCSRSLIHDKLMSLTNGVIDKITNFKAYSSAIVALSTETLGSIIIFNKLEQDGVGFLTLVDCLSIDSLVHETLRVFLRVHKYLPGFNQPIVGHLLGRLLQLVVSNDDQIRFLTLRLLAVIVRPDMNYECDTRLICNLTKILKFRDTASICLILEILSAVLKSRPGNIHDEREIVAALVDLLNSGEFDAGHDELRDFIRVFAKDRPDFFESFSKLLDQTNPCAIEVLAIVCLQNQLIDFITKCETDLVNLCKSDTVISPEAPTLFLVRFMGYVGSEMHLSLLRLGSLVLLLSRVSVRHNATTNEVPTSNEVTVAAEVLVSAIVDSIGLIAKHETAIHLPELMTIYCAPENAFVRHLLVLALKPLLQALEKQSLCEIWQQIWQCINAKEFEPSSLAELRNSADVLCEIGMRSIELVTDGVSLTHESKLCLDVSAYSVAYTHAALIKELIKRLDTTDENIAILRNLIEGTSGWLETSSIEIRQLLIGNLLTALNMKPSSIIPILNDVLIPILFKQLSPNPEFMRTIPMGPYKYVVDEGLEIRKLSYEFIHSVLAMDLRLISEHEIPITEIAKKIAENGLDDDQHDVFVLSIINLLNIFDNHRPSFNNLIASDDGQVLNGMIESFTKQLKKKLSDKASPQDIDVHNERIRSVVKLSKKIDQAVCKLGVNSLHSLHETRGKWASYVEFLNSDFQLSLNL